MAGPLPFRRRLQMSELMRSESFQSGPCSSSTTFLPARASTAAKTPPEAPAPTMTASTFSCVAMSPFPFGQNVRQVRDPDPGETFDGAVAQCRIDLRLGRLAVPPFDLLVTQEFDEFELFGLAELVEFAAMHRL